MAGVAAPIPPPAPGEAPDPEPDPAPRILFAPRDLPPLRPDAASDLPRYRAWVDERRRERLGAGATASDANDHPDRSLAPAITFLLAADRGDRGALRRCVRALRAQSERSWRLSVAVVGGSGRAGRGAAGRRPRLRGRAGEPGQVSVRAFPGGTGIPEALGALLQGVVTPAVALLDLSDRLEPDAVALLAGALRHADLAYADEDEVDPDGRLWRPRLKPGWSPDLLLSTPYLGRPLAVRLGTLRAAGGIRPVPGGDWEHDLMLRATEGDVRVAHVAEVLCHRRGDGARGIGLGGGSAVGAGGGVDPGTGSTGDAAVVDALARRGEACIVEPGPLPRSYRLRRHAGRPTSVSVIVPFRDQPRYLRACVDSLNATAPGSEVELELLLVDNGSADPETLSLVERLQGRPGVTVLRDPRPFNWAGLNNAAAAVAKGEVLLFVNDDVQAIRPCWVEALVSQALRPDVGAVGARLLYPSGRVQHAGMVVGLGGAAGHVLVGLAEADPGYLGMAVLARECSAVTGACLATRRTVFDALGGFDEQLGLDLNDVDYCLRARERGWRVLYEPTAELVHHESPSRGTSGSVPDILRFVDRWEPLLLSGDPYLNPNLTRTDGSCALAGPDEKGRWLQWRSTLETS